MPQERADLSALHTPLPQRGSRGKASLETPGRPSSRKSEDLSELAEKFPSLGAPAREHMTSLSVRIPVSMADRLERFCTKHKIDKSSFVRDGIASALTEGENAGR